MSDFSNIQCPTCPAEGHKTSARRPEVKIPLIITKKKPITTERTKLLNKIGCSLLGLYVLYLRK